MFSKICKWIIESVVKKLLNKVWDYIWVSICSFIIGVVYYMLDFFLSLYSSYNREIYSLFFAFLTFIFCIFVKKELKKYNSVKNKLKVVDTRLRLVHNNHLDFALCLDNLANQVVECYVDIDLSSFIVNNLAIPKEKLQVNKITLYPWSIHNIWVHIMDINSLNITQKTISISCKMYLKYNEHLQSSNYLLTCKFQGEFDLNSTNDQFELRLIKVIQPASPID